ncbi:hypothetical protein EVAR_39113_1 [Eumeta japonica]|uniref:Uncharacterized protein n=1 Tax=Eumeta variegata TaxID=151549 RepID=A0A4C1X7V8_EUMVA|nr:hypothetical protein EVAR_39113_1 [Eumeta japonica]
MLFVVPTNRTSQHEAVFHWTGRRRGHLWLVSDRSSTIKEEVVTVVHGHQQLRRTHGCVTDLLDKNEISEDVNEGASGLMEEERDDGGSSGPSKFRLTVCNATTKAVTPVPYFPYSVRVSYLIGGANSFSSCNQVGHSTVQHMATVQCNRPFGNL